MIISFVLNNKLVEADALPNQRLSVLLRESFKLNTVRDGCRQGTCGACLVIMDKKLANSCLIPAFSAKNSEITTIEGIAETREFEIIVESFKRANLYICDFCAPARALSVYHLLTSNEPVDDISIKETINSVSCRCSHFSALRRGIQMAAARIRKGGR